MNRALILCASLAFIGLASPAVAQDHTDHQMPGMDMSNDPAAAAYKAAMDKMHADMGSVQPSGNADVDFARGMIPHHQAAIDMAKAQLEYGKDPEIRKLSEDIIAAQEREIKQLQDWLAKNAPK
ncbi:MULTISPECIES: CopM family metallochaperone [Mesorhizobium]|uniref:DUF305 domain-containing protein n=1 Tax=Mesorhizobium denitrificans TaxID=2294114 RepID=A0A371XGB3_9HYPH|nr:MULTISPECIES: DUF305 domain-containing protein [Mesorhizobium]RFC68266.1 DUF305 domain-containing protein [Mesorhizobium denitrificans]